MPKAGGHRGACGQHSLQPTRSPVQSSKALRQPLATPDWLEGAPTLSCCCWSCLPSGVWGSAGIKAEGRPMSCPGQMLSAPPEAQPSGTAPVLRGSGCSARSGQTGLAHQLPSEARTLLTSPLHHRLGQRLRHRHPAGVSLNSGCLLCTETGSGRNAMATGRLSPHPQGRLDRVRVAGTCLDGLL